ncbi:MAG: FG-GAP repeat domain-containing protein [Planctomycetota bacterium]
MIGVTLATMLATAGWAGAPGDQAPVLSFDKGSQPFATKNTFQIALGDVDGDGDLDAALANARHGRSQVLLNNGAGLFRDTNQRLTPQGHGLVLGDLDGDGDLDLFVTCAHYGETADSMRGLPSRVYLNNGKGRFSDTGQDLNDTDRSGNAVSLHDIDGDGDLDAAVDYHQHANGIYLNEGNGRFALSKTTYPDGSTWGDLDADGDVDLFVRQIGSGFKTMVNDGSGNFTDHWSLPCKDLTHGRGALGDLDGDGDLDGVVTNGDWESQHPTRVLLNEGGGTFTDTGQPLTAAKWGRIALGDLDRDGDLDLVVTGFEQQARIWLNEGGGRFRESPAQLSDDKQHFADVSLGDLDNDQDLDIFFANFFGGPNEIWFNQSR